MCVDCYQNTGQPHKMKKLSFDLDSSGEARPANNPQEVRKLSIQQVIQSLVHGCQCRDASCQLPTCYKMKQVVSHSKQCKRKTNGGGPICKQLIALCCYHAKLCQVRPPPTPPPGGPAANRAPAPGAASCQTMPAPSTRH